MKPIQKYAYLIVLSLFLLAVAIFVGVQADMPRLQLFAPVQSQPAFVVANPDGSETERITIYDAGDGNCYVFLPSYAALDRVSVVEGKGHSFSLGGEHLSDGLNCEIYQMDTPYALSADGQHVANLWFCRSENMPALYIDTISGNLEGILHDTFPEETASARLYTAAGDRDLLDEYAAIKCRGYSSWNFDKKSYTLSLRQSKRLLNMGTSEKWVLIANGYDETHLRNRIVYSFADAVSAIPAWSPDCTPTELYLNGEYAGVYLLCQKPDAGPDHLNLAPEDYYFEMMLSGRSKHSPTVFDICASESVEVKFPKNCNAEEIDYLKNYLIAFQTALLSEAGNSDANTPVWSDYIDMDSWARKYLVEEIFSNCDGGRASSFCWLDTTAGKLYAGPCWDYDRAVGCTSTGMWDSTYSLLVQRDWGEDTSWFHALCRKDEFMDTVVKLYKTEFRPLLQEYAGERIPAFAEEIRSAIPSEYLRWPTLHGDAGWDASMEAVITFIQERIAFLDALWLEKAEFCRISDGISNMYVPAGVACENLPAPAQGGIWYLAGTDIPFDATLPVTCDVELFSMPESQRIPPEVPPEEEAAAPAETLTTQDYITMLSIFALVLLLLCFVAVDFFRRKKDRRKADAPSRRKVSS